MKQTATEHTIDVRPMAPRLRHPTIFNTFNSMEGGDSILLINDHDPVPLYYQFACEFAGGFRWDYLENGPERWQVRIGKGEFADPGFVPTCRAATPTVAPIDFLKPLVLDTRPIFARGETPCAAIDQATASVVPGQLLVLLVPFEPVPLYTKLGHQGFTHQAKQMDDGSWRVEFKRSATAPEPKEAHSCCCGHD